MYGSMQQQAATPLFDAATLAAFLRVSQRTLETLIVRGEAPPFVRLGRQRRWRHEDVQAWLEAAAHGGPTSAPSSFSQVDGGG